jgi:hypothetical protein
VKVGCLGKERGRFLAVSPLNRCTPFFRDMHSVDCFVVLFGRKESADCEMNLLSFVVPFLVHKD